MREDQEIIVQPLSGAVGAVIEGVDLSEPLHEATLAKLKRTYDEFGVIFFRDQQLSPEDHIAFAEQWGKINVNRFFQPVEGYPRIAEVRKEPEQKYAIGSGWHTDHSYDEVPAMGSILYALEVPSKGGDTLFSSMSKAYDALSDGLKEMLGTLQAHHSSRHVFGAEAARDEEEYGGRIGNPKLATQDAIHPVILTHPRTGKKGIYVNPDFTVKIHGWSKEESDPLLQFLYQHAARPEFQCRFRWERGSIAFWDNLATWHYALNDYHGERRLMHRITLDGTPIG